MNEEEVKLLFGKRLKEIRLQNKLSQSDLAEKIDISFKYLSRIEIGQQFPSINIFLKLSEALKIELNELFDFTHLKKNKKELQNTLKVIIKNADEDKLRTLLKIYKTLP